VPSSQQTSPGTTLQPSVLLLEEYDALAVAIGSALKKFAPRHATKRVRSLAEAEKITKKFSPDLFIIDFDPAYTGLTEFLQKMRDSHPDSRVLIIAPGVSRELAAERRPFAALQFVQKPFDLPDFGATVQALLGPWKESESAHSRGTLSSLNVADIILLQCVGGRSVTIEIKGSNGYSGRIHVRDGQLIHAETEEATGTDALEEILAWPQAKIREAEKPPARKRTIKGPWAIPFFDACRKVEARPPRPIASPKETVPAKRPPKTGKKIVVVDDTEMLLIFVEDVLTTADPQLQITAALNGTSGIKEIERVTPDLILLDYSLPDINGDEVCRRLLQNEQTAGIPVLMMSGHVAEMAQAAATLKNIVATIEKPFLSEALITLVQQTLSAKPRPAKKKAIESPKKVQPLPPPVAAPPPAAAEEASFRDKELPKKGLEKPRKVEPPPIQIATVPLPAAKEPPQRDKEEPKIVERTKQAAEEILGTSSQPAATGAWPVEASKMPPRPIADTAAHRIVSKPSIPTAAPVTPELRMPPGATISAPVFATETNNVILGLFLEVVSMQLTESLRMGTIRAKPSSLTVSLHFASAALRAALPANGFQLGPVEIDKNGRIATLRLTPTLQPFTPLETRNALQIGGLAVVPANAHEHVQLMSKMNAPMRMQLLAPLELAGVELSDTFQVAQLVLKSRANTMRVTFSSKSADPEETGVPCEAAGVKLDASAQIEELLLQPIK
jgi:DNA-binding response OmpR family regulator